VRRRDDDGYAGYTLGKEKRPVEITESWTENCPVCASFATFRCAIRNSDNTGGYGGGSRTLPHTKYSRFAAHARAMEAPKAAISTMQDQLSFHQWDQTGNDPSRLLRDLAKATVAPMSQG